MFYLLSVNPFATYIILIASFLGFDFWVSMKPTVCMCDGVCVGVCMFVMLLVYAISYEGKL